MTRLVDSKLRHVILALAVALLLSAAASDQRTEARADMQILKSALNLYRDLAGHFPSTKQGLKALVERPAAGPKPKMWRSVLEKEIRDPWNFEFVYKCPGEKNRDSYDLFSVGPDSKAGTPDDVWPK
jgi:general secretion pathway protein G